jgi:hypothetical protein
MPIAAKLIRTKNAGAQESFYRLCYHTVVRFCNYELAPRARAPPSGCENRQQLRK